MRLSFRRGLSFGLTSSIITTVGLMVGLASSTGQRSVVLAGVITIALADALSDALGMHISVESAEGDGRSVWEATVSTFLSKFFFALTFIIPPLLFSLNTALLVSVAYGMILLAVLSFWIAKSQGEKPVHVITEHLIIALVVIVLTYVVGSWVGTLF